MDLNCTANCISIQAELDTQSVYGVVTVDEIKYFRILPGGVCRGESQFDVVV